MILTTSIETFEKAAVEGSVFNDYATMLLMRLIGSIIMAILLLLLVFYPLYTLLWRFLRQKFPAIGENPYLKKHKAAIQDADDYEDYIKWTERNGYEPVIVKKINKNRKRQ